MSNSVLRLLPAWVVAASAVAAAASSPARAQAIPPDPSIDQRVQSLVRPGTPSRSDDEEAILTGRDDIILMQKHHFFTLSGSVDLLDTTNAQLSPTDRISDRFLTANIGIRVATKLGGLVDVYAEAGLNTARYFDQKSLNYVAAVGGVGMHVPVLSFDFDLGYTPVVVWDGDWRQRQLTQHRFAGSIGRGLRIGQRAFLRISAGGERTEANPSPFRNSAATASVSAIWIIAPRLSALISVRGARRWYDNYYEGLLGTRRRDWSLEGAVGISWQVRPRVGIDLRWAQTRNWSTSDVSRYDAGVGGLTLRTAFQF